MRTIKLEDYERGLDARKAALGYAGHDHVAPNSGASRLAKKRELLRALSEMAEAEGRAPPFAANF